jgi:uncharacterized protein (DUF1697 family)
MHTHIALLRGINIGGRNILPMSELAELLKGLGLQNIKTYIQSGNVVFQSEEIADSELSERIGAAIGRSRGFTPSVLLLRLAELESAISSNPFPEAESQPKTLHLFFLADVPEDPDLNTIESIKRDSERFALKDRVFYLHAPDGVGRSKLAARVEKSLGVAVTARNWRSVNKIMAIARVIAKEGD